MLSNKLLLAGVIIFFLHGCSSNKFPTVEEVDKVLSQYRLESRVVERTTLIKDMLKRLSVTAGVKDDDTVRYAIGRLIKEYEATNDEAILAAVDSTKIDGGFANFVCEFYGRIKDQKKFTKRCQDDPKAIQAVERCIGISLSRGDLQAIAPK
jgi:hypothetical protein